MHAPTDLLGSVPRIIAKTTALHEVGNAEVADGSVLTSEAAVELVQRVVYNMILGKPV